MHAKTREIASLPDVEVGVDCLLAGLVLAADVKASALVCHQFPVRLHHDRVEVLDVLVLREREPLVT